MGLPTANPVARMRAMTTLKAEQFEIVVRELETMLADSALDEFWRVMKMFASGRFNYGVGDFPARLQKQFAALGPVRRKSYAALLQQVEELDPQCFEVVELGRAGRLPLVKITTRPPASAYAARVSICVVAGIHGDEPDGILGALEFARRFAQSRELTGSYALTMYPCINPHGYEQMTRENANGRDLNREFFRGSAEPEVRIMERELGQQQFSGFIAGHSDYESFGLYAYATGAVLSERLAKPALFQASAVIPINMQPVIDGHPARYGIINEKFPGSLGPLSKGPTEPFDITIETPNLFALRKRVEAQAIAFETVLHEYRAVAAEAMYL
jgi:protein MpaA